MDKDEKAFAGVPKFQRRLTMIMMIIMIMMVMIMMVVMIRMMILMMMIMMTKPHDDDADTDDDCDHKNDSYIAVGAAPGASVSCFFYLALWSRLFGLGLGY